MANYKVGDYIRLIRNANDMTQEELAFRAGVATETISRIENGKHKITKNVYRKIMSVFDYFPQQFYGICTDNDIEIMDIKQAEEDAEVKFEYEAAREYLEILRQKAGDTLVNRQYILRAEAVLDCRIGKIDVQEMLEKLIDALKLTLNNYESILNTGKIYPFTEIEASILMNISDAYGIIEEYECDEKIKRMILKCLEAEYVDGQGINNLILAIKRNLGYTLLVQKKYDEAMNFFNRLLLEAKKAKNGIIISIVLSDIAWTMKKKNQKSENKVYEDEKIKKILRQAYYLAAARNDNFIKDRIEKTFKTDYNEDIGINGM